MVNLTNKIITLPDAVIAKGNVISSMNRKSFKRYIEEKVCDLVEKEYEEMFKAKA